MSLSRSEQIAEYGWTSLPCDPAKWGGNKKYNKEPVPQLCSSISLPDTALVKAAMEHVKQELPEHTFNHSMRVFYYVDKHTHGTLMSFEFYGGYLAMDQLKQFNSPAGQAESVAEAIIRHQDPVETGTITTVGLLIQLATQFDNMGYRAGYVHEDTIKDVVKNYPRRNWSGCFSKKIREEVEVKPWCHTTASTGKFPHDVEHNELMAPYDHSY
ncbi:cyanamide hydratase [Aureobasidium pullulans]|uniref:Cyanamide hydratase n=1 Tax=Aureobasidium pullulans TaxID=5580 RepID=A0A4S8S463_AURPU|nr:cyanamide hydratase [Aureobasidium pullulans]